MQGIESALDISNCASYSYNKQWKPSSKFQLITYNNCMYVAHPYVHTHTHTQWHSHFRFKLMHTSTTTEPPCDAAARIAIELQITPFCNQGGARMHAAGLNDFSCQLGQRRPSQYTYMQPREVRTYIFIRCTHICHITASCTYMHAFIHSL